MEDSQAKVKADEAAVNALLAKVPGLDFETVAFAGDVTAVVPVERLIEVLNTARENGFALFVDMAAVHYPGRAKCFEVAYVLRNVDDPARLRVKTAVAEDESVPTATVLWPAANWHEREAFDLFGIDFAGHPNLTRLFMPDGFKGHPLRKEFPLKGND